MPYAAYEYRSGCPESSSGLHRGVLRRFLLVYYRQCYLCGHRWFFRWPWD